MRIGANGLKLIKYFEGLYLNAYICTAGKPTIGYGVTIYPKGFKYHGPVRLGQTITEAEADWLLEEVLKKYENAVSNFFKVPLNQYQFDALTSFAYNLGGAIFSKCTFAKALNSGDYISPYDGFEQFCRYKDSSGVSRIAKGLQKRRLVERELFYYGVELSKSKN